MNVASGSSDPTNSAAQNTQDASPSSDMAADEGPSPSGLWTRLKSLIGIKANPTLREDLNVALATDVQDENSLSPEERTMLRNVLTMHEVRVEDLAVPRASIVAVEANVTLSDLLLVFEDQGHSRMPVYNETLDDPLGMVHIKDVMAYITTNALKRQANATSASGTTDHADEANVVSLVDSQGDADASEAASLAPCLDMGCVDLTIGLVETNLVRPLLFVPPSMPASDLLATMQASRTQMALVIDEYGGTDGLASIEDVVEEIVGEIEDEHDEDNAPIIEAQANGSFIIDANAELDQVRENVGADFVVSDEEDVDTIGGLIFTLVGRVPVRGELINRLEGFEIEILDADRRRIKRLRLRPHTPRLNVTQQEAAKAPIPSDAGDNVTAEASDAVEASEKPLRLRRQA